MKLNQGRFSPTSCAKSQRSVPDLDLYASITVPLKFDQFQRFNQSHNTCCTTRTHISVPRRANGQSNSLLTFVADVEAKSLVRL